MPWIAKFCSKVRIQQQIDESTFTPLTTIENLTQVLSKSVTIIFMSSKIKIRENQQLPAVSRLFSPVLFRELAKYGRSPLFARLANETATLELTTPDKKVRDLFDAAFGLLKNKHYRHEYIYKAAIANKILLGTHSLQTSVMLNEFRVGNNKADSVILNGTSSVYEIKSERDTLTRLDQQICSYRKVFATVNVITGEKHLRSVNATVPQDVGILLLTDRYQISTIRAATDAPERTLPEAIFDSLRLLEAKKVLTKCGVEIPVLPNTKMFCELRKLFLTLSPLDAHSGMVEVLKATRTQKVIDELLGVLPHSLQAAALSSTLRKRDHINLVAAMETPMSEALKWS